MCMWSHSHFNLTDLFFAYSCISIVINTILGAKKLLLVICINYLWSVNMCFRSSFIFALKYAFARNSLIWTWKHNHTHFNNFLYFLFSSFSKIKKKRFKTFVSVRDWMTKCMCRVSIIITAQRKKEEAIKKCEKNAGMRWCVNRNESISRIQKKIWSFDRFDNLCL